MWYLHMCHHLCCVFPVQVQPHMKKCFDNIKTLDMSKMRDRWEASHMNSTEGEKVEFSSVIHLEGAVEVGRQRVHSVCADSWHCWHATTTILSCSCTVTCAYVHIYSILYTYVHVSVCTYVRMYVVVSGLCMYVLCVYTSSN